MLKAENMTHFVSDNFLEAVIVNVKLALCFSEVLKTAK
jgi:hypothetical protein